MRKLSLASVTILAFGIGLTEPYLLQGTPAFAQTPSGSDAGGSGNQRALDALGPTRSVHAPVSPPHHHPVHHARAVQGQGKTRPVKPAARPPSPTIPAGPPPPPLIKAPVIDVPLHPQPPPPPVPVVATATGAVSGIPDGSRMTFGDGSADLNARMMQGLQAFAATLKAAPEQRAQIDAYAAGTPDDPSTPRRMSLARGLAARAVLINAGIASTRIYVRAIGQPHDDGPANRIDVTHSDITHPDNTQHTADQPAAASGKAATAP